MDIVCNIDDRYVAYCGIMLTSLLENNRDSRVNIHIVAASLLPKNADTLRRLAKSYGANLHLYLVGDELIKDLPHFEGDYISLSTYFRCFLDEILPQDIHRVIYLDCDILVLGSLRPLWDTDIDHAAIAVVEDMNSSFTDKHARLGLPQSYTYFNAGMMLINLDYWRAHDVQRRLMEWLAANRDRIVAHDQDLLNAVLHSELVYLPHRWNMQEGMLRRRRHTLPSSDEAIDREMHHTVIVHFAGKHKPWQQKCINPYKREWRHYTDLSPWRGMRPRRTVGFQLNRLTFPIQDRLGLRNGYRPKRR